jgi:Zn-dependent protease
MAYVSNRTIYERSKSARVCYYCAGIVANFVLACAFYAVPWSKIDPELVATAHLALVVNAVLFFFNLYPFLFTDGFNVLREVLEVYNLREIVVRGFFRPRQILASSRAAFGYYIFLLLSMGVLAFRFASWIVALGR